MLILLDTSCNYEIFDKVPVVAATTVEQNTITWEPLVAAHGIILYNLYSPLKAGLFFLLGDLVDEIVPTCAGFLYSVPSKGFGLLD